MWARVGEWGSRAANIGNHSLQDALMLIKSLLVWALEDDAIKPREKSNVFDRPLSFLDYVMH